jgi:hypothetical protein
VFTWLLINGYDTEKWAENINFLLTKWNGVGGVKCAAPGGRSGAACAVVSNLNAACLFR